MKRIRILLRSLLRLGALAILLDTGLASAATFTWVNPAGGDFLAAGNWSPAQSPTSVDTTIFNSASGTVTLAADATVSSMSMNAGSNVSLDLGGKTLQVASLSASSGNATFSNGAMQLKFLSLGGTTAAPSAFTLTGGTQGTFTGNSFVSLLVGSNSTFNMQAGATLQANRGVWVRGNNSATNRSLLNLDGAGTKITGALYLGGNPYFQATISGAATIQGGVNDTGYVTGDNVGVPALTMTDLGTNWSSGTFKFGRNPNLDGTFDQTTTALIKNGAELRSTTAINGYDYQSVSAKNEVGTQYYQATLTLTDPGTKWTMPAPLVLHYATLTISNGALVSDTYGILVPQNEILSPPGIARAIVNVTGAGSQWNNSADILFGYNGSIYPSPATLSVQGGGKVAAVNCALRPGGSTAATASYITVSDPGSRLDLSGTLTTSQTSGGHYSQLQILNGGAVTDNAASIGCNVQVSGAGSRWDTVGEARMDNSLVRYMLQVQEGAAVSADTFYPGDLVVSGTGSKLTATSAITTLDGTSLFSVLNGASISAPKIQLKLYTFFGPWIASGTVSGANSKISASDSILINTFNSTGTLTIDQGGLMEAPFINVNFNEIAAPVVTNVGTGGILHAATSLRMGSVVNNSGLIDTNRLEINSYGSLNQTAAGTLANRDSRHIFIEPYYSGGIGSASATYKFAVSANSSYAGNGSTVLENSYGTSFSTPSLANLHSYADILAGKNSGSDKQLTMQWRRHDATDVAANGASLVSEVFSLSGMTLNGAASGQTDPFTLQMGYDTSLISGTDATLMLMTLDPTSGKWVNAVDENFGMGAFAQAHIVSSWSSFASANSITDLNLGNFLGSWGIDPTSNAVWAVLDHNSQFSVVPEPTSGMLIALGTMSLVIAWHISQRKPKQSTCPKP